MKITGIDHPCMDMGIFCERIPEDGGWEPIHGMTLMGGGKIPNALAAAARLGAEASLIGTVGADRYGNACREDLAWNGVSTDHLFSRPGTTALCLCIADKEGGGKRCIESVAAFEHLKADEWDDAWLAGADTLLLYEFDATAVRAATAAKAAGITVLADGDEYDEKTQQALPLIDIFIMSEYYYRHLFGEDEDFEKNLATLRDKGPQTVIVTLGGEGCAGIGADGAYFRLPAFAGYPIIDTTGAGDVFHGAFAYYAAKGFPAEEAARHASAVSFIKCTRLGGRTALPSEAGVEHFLKTGEILPEDFAEREAYYRQAAFR